MNTEIHEQEEKLSLILEGRSGDEILIKYIGHITLLPPSLPYHAEAAEEDTQWDIAYAEEVIEVFREENEGSVEISMEEALEELGYHDRDTLLEKLREEVSYSVQY